MLQFAVLTESSVQRGSGFQDIIEQFHKKYALPETIQKKLFIDPAYPLQGYTISEEGEIEFELFFERIKNGDLQIKHIGDWRKEPVSEPLQLMLLSTDQFSVLKPFEQIEDPNKILVWGKKGKCPERIELPRYGLEFVLKEGFLECTDHRLAGYRVCLSSSVEERRGFFCSLLLEHPDKTRPKKLLLPPASAISQTYRMSLPSGLAFIVWCIQKLYTFLLTGVFNPPRFLSQLQIQSSKVALPVTLIDFHPHTEAWIYTSGQEREQCQELILQAICLNNEQLALDVFRTVKIPQEEGAIRKWLKFAEVSGAVVGLRICNKLFQQVQGEKKYKDLLKSIQEKERHLFKSYLKQVQQLPRHLLLPQDVYNRIDEDRKA